MSFRIRAATIADAAAIAELISELGYTSTGAEVTERLVALVVDNRCLVLVAAAPEHEEDAEACEARRGPPRWREPRAPVGATPASSWDQRFPQPASPSRICSKLMLWK